MALNARERTRYARHLLLPEIGLAGQERLLATHVQLAGNAHPGAAQVARTYLERAGVTVEEEAEQRVQVADEVAVERLAGHPALRPAAAALAGALSAVEAIKEVLQLGTRGDLSLAEIVMGPVEAGELARDQSVESGGLAREHSEDV